MEYAPGQPPVVAESLQTHTPPDPRAGALALSQEHAKELRQQRQNQLPPVPVRSVQHVVPHVHDLASGTQGRARQV